jgi:hypothetical protein
LTASDFDKVFGQARPASFAQRVGKEAGANGEAFAGTGEYKPYGFLPTGTVNETCEIVRWVEGTEIPEGIDFQYRFLMQVGFVGEEQLKLFLPDCIVVIEGHNLRDLRKKLARRQVTFVQQYTARIWPKKPLKGEAVINAITVARPNYPK